MHGVVNSFNKDGATLVEFTNSNSYTNDQSKPWLDSSLFNEAMHDLLGEAIRYRDDKEPVRFSLNSVGTNHWRVDITYILSQAAGERFNDTSGYPYFYSVRTRDIISQHHAKMCFETKNLKVNVHVAFEK